MANLIEYLPLPLKKLFNTKEFKSAIRRYTKPVSPVSYPYMWYPEAGLTNEGVKFRYIDGTELTSYHIKGIAQINSSGNGFEQYLCSVKFSSVGEGGAPFIMPGSITGMFMSGGEGNIITTPFANGALVELNGSHVPVSSLDVNLYPYNNPQEDGSYIYALVIDATVENPDNYGISGLISYDFEFLLDNYQSAPTIFQD